MTHPLTPREKVAEIVRNGMNRLAASQAGARPVVSASKEADRVTDAILTALASGSGDHAELARLAEAASGSEWQTYISGRPEYRNVTHYIEQNPPRDLPFIAEVQKERDAAFIAAANPAAVLALLAENAALREQREADMAEVARAGQNLQSQRIAITEAERKLAEAEEENSRWAIRFADVREAAGIGVKPMLSEVPGELRQMRSMLDRAAELMRQCTDPDRFEGASTLNVYANMRAWLSSLPPAPGAHP